MGRGRSPSPHPESSRPGAFCWLDLAAADAALARRFYGEAFGWGFEDRRIRGGVYTRCRVRGREIGSIYQLRRDQLDRGVPSHWTPYIAVESADAAVLQTTELGGRLVVEPFEVEGAARIALIQDAVGALVGLWESPPAA